jgi:hypothetical protein
MDNILIVSQAEQFTVGKSEFILMMIASLRWIKGGVRYEGNLPPKYEMRKSAEADAFFRQCMREPDAALRQTLPVELENEVGVMILSQVAQQRLDAIKSI